MPWWCMVTYDVQKEARSPMRLGHMSQVRKHRVRVVQERGSGADALPTPSLLPANKISHILAAPSLVPCSLNSVYGCNPLGVFHFYFLPGTLHALTRPKFAVGVLPLLYVCAMLDDAVPKPSNSTLGKDWVRDKVTAHLPAAAAAPCALPSTWPYC